MGIVGRLCLKFCDTGYGTATVRGIDIFSVAATGDTYAGWRFMGTMRRTMPDRS